MQMAQYTFQYLTNDSSKLIFPTYHSFLGSLGLLLSQQNLNTGDSSSSESEDDTPIFEESKVESPEHESEDVNSFHSKSVIYPDYHKD
jgi:hypothetical protein